MESFRLTAQRTIIGGSKGVRYFFGGKVSEHGGEADSSKALNIRIFRERFPELGDVRVAHSWAGWMDLTLNFLPLVGRNPNQPAQYFCAGFFHGISQATAMGGVLADLMLGRSNPWHKVVVRKPVWLPPEPFRWMVVRGLLAVTNGVDRYYDRKVHNKAASGG